MIQHHHRKIWLCTTLFVLLFMLNNCGRKQKNIFLFDEQTSIHINKLTLPSVRGITAKKTILGNQITWFELNLPKYPTPSMPYLCKKHFTGYNIYRLVRTNIIPKNPCNKKPIKSTTFIDRAKTKSNKQVYYLVRAVFTFKETMTEGPTSLIVQLKD